jgi:hypothetical protein
MTTNAILAPGDTTGGTGTLTVTNKLVLNGTLNFEVNHGLPNSADKIVTLGTFTNAGATLNVTTVGAAVQAGDSFVLFDRAVSNFAAVNLPVLSAPLSWTNKLAVNGSIAVVSGVSLTPVVVTNVPNGANLTLSWPTDHIGWRLVSHTNPALPMATWSTVAGSTTVSTINITINTNNPQVYYRLVYP